MLLITAADVRAVYDTDRDDDALQPFLDVALAFSDANLADKGLATAVLKEIQRYLAAHFVSVTDMGVHETIRTEDISERFTKSEKRPGLLDSRFGRMAVLLDTSRTLDGLTRTEGAAELRIIPACDDD